MNIEWMNVFKDQQVQRLVYEILYCWDTFDVSLEDLMFYSFFHAIDNILVLQKVLVTKKQKTLFTPRLKLMSIGIETLFKFIKYGDSLIKT